MLFVGAVVLASANAVFVLRSLAVALRSRDRIADGAVPSDHPLLSIIVPARNEAHQIARCVRSLLAQAYPRCEVIVVDDRSTDGTRAILRELEGEFETLRVIDGAELPEGWVGKPWALNQGVAVASGSVFLFTDADTHHEPQAAASALAFLQQRSCDAISLLPRQLMGTIGERLALPSIVWTIAYGTGALDDVNDPRKTDVALFNGQYVLITREAYERAGGHAAVRNEIAEDLELARLLKRNGFRTMLLGATELVQTRMYRSFAQLWEGFVKNFALGVRGQPLLAAFALVFFACISPLTPLALLIAIAHHAWLATLLLTCAFVSSLTAVELGLRRFRFPAWSGLTLPVGLPVMLAIFITSLVRHARGGVTWRGRRY